MKKRTVALLVLFAVFAACFAIPFQAGAASSIRILYKCNDTNPNSNTIASWLKVINDGPDALNLSQVTIRYWYTRDTGRPQVSVCDYAQVDADNVTTNCVAMSNPVSTADYYLEVGFTSGAGNVASGSDSGDIQLRVHNDDWSSYSQAYDYSFNASMTVYSQTPYITAYINGVLAFGTEPATSGSGKKFLVIVSKPLYDTGLITQGLNNYLSDLTATGWAPLMITVDSVSSSNPQYVCATPSVLKSVIQSYYGQEYVGFVLIGSDPSIPTAYWQHDPTQPVDPTDLYYADMDPWTDLGNDGDFDSWDSYPGGTYYGAGFAPEMIWGRISAGCISTSLTDEANKVAAYLAKIHNYKVNGSSLTQTQRERMFVFYDGDDFKIYRGDIELFMNLSTKIHGFFDDSITTPEKLKAELENGYQFGCYDIHSGPEAHSISTWSSDVVFNLDYLNSTTPRVHYLNMYCCSACRYQDQVSGDVPNIGATYLFNSNSLMLNVTGSTGSWGFVPRSAYWADIQAGKPIGEALRDYFINWINIDGETGCPKGVLLGDPTITYSVPSSVIPITNKMPYITTNLAGPAGKKRLEVAVGRAFTITAYDLDGDPVTVTLSGLPAGAVTSSLPNEFTWTPAASDDGKIYYLTATASDNPNNQYVEEFSVKVVDGVNDNPPFNLDFEEVYGGNPTGWDKIVFTSGSALTADAENKCSGNYSAKISAPTVANDARFVQLVDLKPNTNYRLSGYIRAQDVQGGSGALLAVEFDGEFPTSSTGHFETNGNWVYAYVDFNSGSHTSGQLQCHLGMYGGVSTGTAWYDDLTLTEL